MKQNNPKPLYKWQYLLLKRLIKEFGDDGYLVLDKITSMCGRHGLDEAAIDEFIALCNDQPCADVATLNVECYGPLVLSFFDKTRTHRLLISRALGLWSVAGNRQTVTEQRSAMVIELANEAKKVRSNGQIRYFEGDDVTISDIL